MFLLATSLSGGNIIFFSFSTDMYVTSSLYLHQTNKQILVLASISKSSIASMDL